MEEEYKKMKKAYADGQAILNKEVSEYVNSLPTSDVVTQANRPEALEPPVGAAAAEPHKTE